jgi:hypothetical protein
MKHWPIILVILLFVIAVAFSWEQYRRWEQPKQTITNTNWGSSQNILDPLGLSYNLTHDRVATECRRAVGGRSAVIVTLGQSLMENSGDQLARYTPSSGVYNFNLLDRKCYLAKDPLLGTTMAGANQATRLADLLVRRKIYDQVVLIPLAYGGTWVSQWAPGGNMHQRMIAGIQYAQDAGLRPMMILWQQGEAEAGNPPQPANGLVWQAVFQSIAKSIRDQHVDAPIYVANSTVCRNEPNEVIRSAQKLVVNNHDILPGPDTDVIPLKERWDGCHFGQSGLDNAARLWVNAIISRRNEETHPRDN